LRKLIIAASVFALAAPAFAAAQPYPDPRDEDIERVLPHPGEIEQVGRTVGDVTDAIMDVDVGPVVDAIDRGRGYPPRRYRDRTLGDIASRDDPYARERIRDQIGAATVGAGAAAREIAILTPILRRSLEDAARRMEAAIYASRYRRDRDYDRGYERDYDRDWDSDDDYRRR
jgi:hypothetical protein